MTNKATLTEATTITVSVDIPEGYTEEEYLRKVAVDKFYARRIARIANDSTYAEEGLAKEVDRLLEEVKIMAASGQAKGFLAASLWLEQNPTDLPVSMARGSGAGFSHLMYALGLTNIDPASPLLFERFLDPSRVGVNVPDIDTNFNDKDREKFRKYVTKKYLKRESLLKRLVKRIFKK